MQNGIIVYLGGFELPDKNAAAHRVLSNAKALRDLGYTVVFLDVDKKLSWENNILNTKREVQGFTCYSRPYPKSKTEWLSYLTDISLFQQVIAQYSNIQAIICYNYQAVALQKLLTCCHKQNIKVVSDCTEWYSADKSNFVFFVLKSFDTWYRMRILQKKLDGLIVISSYLADYYKSCSHVIQIPPLVDLSEDKWRFSRHFQAGETLRLVYAGSPGVKDQIQYLVEALSHVTLPYHLDVIGITKTQYINQFPAHALMLNKIDKMICFHGRLTHSEALSFVRNADYSCFFREDTRVTRAGFPTKFVESISCGTPVFTNRNSDLNEYMKTGEYGVCIDAATTADIETGLSVCFTRKRQRLSEEISSGFDYRVYKNQFCMLQLGRENKLEQPH